MCARTPTHTTLASNRGCMCSSVAWLATQQDVEVAAADVGEGQTAGIKLERPVCLSYEPGRSPG